MNEILDSRVTHRAKLPMMAKEFFCGGNLQKKCVKYKFSFSHFSFIISIRGSMLNNQKLSSGNEGTPLIPLKSSTANSIMQIEELQPQQDDSNNSNGDGLIRDDSLPSRSHVHRRHSRSTVVTIIVFTSSIIILGIIFYNYYYISLSSSSIDEDYTSSSDNSNSIRIEELKSSGAGLEGIHNGAVASDHPVCSKIGLDIMRLKGGNAADAAVATVLCLGIANPASSGFGGGSFILVRSNRSHFESKMNYDDSTSSGSSSKIPLFEDAREKTDDNSNDDDDDVDFMTEVIDCRETAPKKSYRDMYDGLPDEASSIGGLSIAVPGELKGLELLHSRHGSLKWSEVVEPSRILARDGVIIGKHLASDIKSLFTKDFIRYGNFPGIRHYLSNRSYNNNSSSSSDFEYLRKGEILRNPALAETLKQVQEGGADAFYTGEIARKLVTDIQQSGGIVTVEDMENYRATIRSPVRADVAGVTVVGVGPPSSGGAAVIGAIRFLSGYQTPFAANADTLSEHRMVEAMRHVFSIRMSLSDPAYSNSTLDAVNDLIQGNYMDTLRAITKDNDTLPLSKYGGSKWAQMHDVDFNQDVKDAKEGDRKRRRLRRQTINNENADIIDSTISSSTTATKSKSRRRLARPFGYLEDNGTSHLSVVDKDGNSVAITTSINSIFGSLVFSESTGVLLGDTMDDFGVPGKSNFYGLKPSKANFITPGKRPLSSMSPTTIYRKEGNTGGFFYKKSHRHGGWGKLVGVLGGSGGPKIITAVLQVILNVCFLGMPVFDAVSRPRIHDQLIYHDAFVTATEKSMVGENGPTIEVSQRTKDALLNRGHSQLLDIDYTGCVQAIFVDHETDTLSAVSDIRKGGSPAGW